MEEHPPFQQEMESRTGSAPDGVGPGDPWARGEDPWARQETARLENGQPGSPVYQGDSPQPRVPPPPWNTGESSAGGIARHSRVFAEQMTRDVAPRVIDDTPPS